MRHSEEKAWCSSECLLGYSEPQALACGEWRAGLATQTLYIQAQGRHLLVGKGSVYVTIQYSVLGQTCKCVSLIIQSKLK